MPAPPPLPRDFASHSLERKCQKNSATEEDGVHRSWSKSREINRSPASLCPSSSVAFSNSLVLPIPPTPQILRIGFSGRTSWPPLSLANRSKKWRKSSRSWVRSVKSLRADCRAPRRPMDLRIGISAKAFGIRKSPSSWGLPSLPSKSSVGRDNYNRLVELTRKSDPNNFFRINQKHQRCELSKA